MDKGTKMKVEGVGDFSVSVTCPNCVHSFDATDNDDEYIVTGAMFTNTAESCSDMDIDMICPNCDCEFTLDSITY
jgi:hypothetical protein